MFDFIMQSKFDEDAFFFSDALILMPLLAYSAFFIGKKRWIKPIGEKFLLRVQYWSGQLGQELAIPKV